MRCRLRPSCGGVWLCRQAAVLAGAVLHRRVVVCQMCVAICQGSSGGTAVNHVGRRGRAACFIYGVTAYWQPLAMPDSLKMAGVKHGGDGGLLQASRRSAAWIVGSHADGCRHGPAG